MNDGDTAIVGEFFASDNTVTLKYPGKTGEQTFVVRAEMSIGEHERLERELWSFEANMDKAAHAGKDGSKQDQRAEILRAVKASYRPSHLMLLEINLIRWSLPLQLNLKNIARLKPHVVDWLAREIDKLNPREEVVASPTTTSSS